MHSQLIKETCSKVFKVENEEVKIIGRLELGMSNYMYLIGINNDKYTFRIPGEYANVFVDRNKEKEGLEVVAPFNLCGETIYFDDINGYKISKYIEGRVLYHDVQEKDYKNVAKILHKLHSLNNDKVAYYDPFAVLDYYESLNVEPINQKYLKIKSKLLGYKDFLIKQEKVLCHNDAQPSNFVEGLNEQMYLLDYEFFGLNDPLYDVACFGNNDYREGRTLLDVYLGRIPTNDEEKRFYLWRTFQNLQWVQVALYKHELKMDQALNLDFKELSEMFLNNAQESINKVK